MSVIPPNIIVAFSHYNILCIEVIQISQQSKNKQVKSSTAIPSNNYGITPSTKNWLSPQNNILVPPPKTPKLIKVLTTRQLLSSRSLLENYTQILFETFNVPAANIQVAPVLEY
jgi:actin-related protein